MVNRTENKTTKDTYGHKVGLQLCFIIAGLDPALMMRRRSNIGGPLCSLAAGKLQRPTRLVTPQLFHEVNGDAGPPAPISI